MTSKSHITHNSMTAKSRVRNIVIGAVTALTLAATSIVPAQAFSEEFIEYKLHLLRCSVIVFTDPATHLRECGVGDRSGAGINFTGTGSNGHYCRPGYQWNYSLNECVHSYTSPS